MPKDNTLLNSPRITPLSSIYSDLMRLIRHLSGLLVFVSLCVGALHGQTVINDADLSSQTSFHVLYWKNGNTSNNYLQTQSVSYDEENPENWIFTSTSSVNYGPPTSFTITNQDGVATFVFKMTTNGNNNAIGGGSNLVVVLGLRAGSSEFQFNDIVVNASPPATDAFELNAYAYPDNAPAMIGAYNLGVYATNGVMTIYALGNMPNGGNITITGSFVNVTTAVPEPAVLALVLSVASAGYVGWRHRRRVVGDVAARSE